MSYKYFSQLAAIVWLAIIPAALCFAQGGTRADYARSASLGKRTQNTVFFSHVNPHWAVDGNSFWYRDVGPAGKKTYWRVNAIAGTRSAIINPASLGPSGFADSLAATPFIHPSGNNGPETTVDFINRTSGTINIFWINQGDQREPYGKVRPGNERDMHTYAGHVWLATSAAGKTLGVFTAVEGGGTAVVDGNMKRSPRRNHTRFHYQDANPPVYRSNNSPDGKWTALTRDGNVFIRTRSEQTSADFQLTTTAKLDDNYGNGEFYWSPDSKHLVAIRTQDGDHRRVYVVQSSPSDQLQPKLLSWPYLKPGDRVPIRKPHLFDITTHKQISVSDALYKNPFGTKDFRWQPDGKRFTFIFNQRGHQALRLIGIDANTGHAAAIINETSKTFIDYSGKSYIHYMPKTHEIIWMSERDGWNHLYLYDSNTGTVKNRITTGHWVVRHVDHIDEHHRIIYFRASGIVPGQDPYYIHYCRVNFDGTELFDLTPGDGTHEISPSPDGRFFIDSYSRVDMPPVSELRRSRDGKLVCPLERADMTKLLATGWQTPERFVAKGRDGKTNIYGVIFRPSNFNPHLKYPVVENIYAGPQSSYVPKSFSPDYSSQAMAELGFIVVQIDGMGTSNRSRAFQDICWHNLGDAGFPDRILWIKAAAKKHPEMDISKGVGLYGTSAGGQDALRGLEAFRHFYTVAVADCGCHDNRMDKIWWNEQWMGWPIGPWYAAQSNVTNAHNLYGALFLIVAETDHNVDPASTMQVVNALIKANKDFDLLVIPNADHGQDGAYGDRRRKDFLVKHLLHVEPRAQ